MNALNTPSATADTPLEKRGMTKSNNKKESNKK